MTDRELLEAAAKAAGLALCKGHKGATFDVIGNAVLDWHNGVTWNPLADDGDALRLAVKLGIRVEPSPRGCSVMWPCAKGLRVETILCSVIGAGLDAATRRAIVRAAAAIGGSR